MKKNMLFIISLSTFLSNVASQEQFFYRVAQLEDVSSIMNLINQEAVKDRSRIVILPEKFRQEALLDSVNKSQLFVATKADGQVVGFKKLKCLQEKEIVDVLYEEIRMGQKNLVDGVMPSLDIASDLFLYTGGDFTHPDYRKHKINTHLTQTAFEHIRCMVEQRINTLTSLVLLYGLTEENARNHDGQQGLYCGRTQGILKQFESFIKKIGLESKDEVALSRYQAFMPTFDLQSQECAPLPDEQAVPGYGYIAVYTIKQ